MALKKGYRRLAAVLIAIPLAIGFVMGTYSPFLSSGTDNVFRMAAGDFTPAFQVSAVLLIFFKALGMWIGVRTLTSRA